MKIVAKTGHGFLAEITEDEIAKCCGFGSTYSEGWTKLVAEVGVSRGYRGDRAIGIGSTIEITKLHDWHVRLRDAETKAVASAAALRSLADMMTGMIPSAIMAPPDPPDEAGDKATETKDR